MKTSYGAKLRALLSSLLIKQIIDFTKIRVFDSLVASCVLIICKNPQGKDISVTNINEEIINQISLSEYVEENKHKINAKNLNMDIWLLQENRSLSALFYCSSF
jgi:hypothetical protein